MKRSLIFFLLVYIVFIGIYDVFASSFEALRKLQEINRALKGTVQRMKEENRLNPENREQVEKDMKRVFQEELEKAQRGIAGTGGAEDFLVEQGLKQCEQMKKRKEELSASAGRKIITGAFIGAGIGAAVSDRDKRTEGAILGALSGVIVATAHELWTKKDLFEESAERVAKRIRYTQDKGIHLKISKLEFNKRNYKDNEDARLILRVELLTPDFKLSDDASKSILSRIVKSKDNEEVEIKNSKFYDIKIEAFLIREGKELFIAEEVYSVPMGSYPFLYVFPMCPIIPKGVYELKFRVSHGEMSDEKVVSFEKI